MNAYRYAVILQQSLKLDKGGSTAVTGILIHGQKLVVANVGDSRAVMSKNGVMSNKEVVDAIKSIKDPQTAAKHLIEEAISKEQR
ncbi:hypothetical protein HID58_040933 [Brassica napus]|uniref:PPM-type phosphatase domain-containing protein n=1 Tax=Brassica napus TaxID=3708 RepID=A0ABQ8B9F2_BRANA|nr:hypothetical protein HID58_040933 [Brassica napus]